MTGEIAVRFVLGGLIVSLFAAAGEMFKPKTFAGLFGAAPSVALASLAIAYWTKGNAYVAIAARSMMLGAMAFVAYGVACVATTKVRAIPVWMGAGLAWAGWAAVAFLSWRLVGPGA